VRGAALASVGLALVFFAAAWQLLPVQSAATSFAAGLTLWLAIALFDRRLSRLRFGN
jgi:hypothetical protein